MLTIGRQPLHVLHPVIYTDWGLLVKHTLRRVYCAGPGPLIGRRLSGCDACTET